MKNRMSVACSECCPAQGVSCRVLDSCYVVVLALGVPAGSKVSL